MKTRFTILGSGSPLGIPRIDGYFGKCNPKIVQNFRSRCSALVTHDKFNILIDTSPDLKTQLLKNKLNLNFGATFDAYALDDNNRRINKFNINNGGGLFRVTSANLTFNYSLSSSDNKKESKKEESMIDESLRNGGRDDDLFGIAMDTASQAFNLQDEEEDEIINDLYKYKIPWSLRLAYAINYNNIFNQNEISSHSLMFSGNVDLSPKWNAGISSGYDFKNNGITYTQLRFERDLLSWRMNFSWIPFSANKQWNFFIGIKSGILSDIKYDKRRQRDKIL